MNLPLSPAETTAQSSTRAAGLFWLSALLRPIRGFRLNYLPLAMIYFAYGALGLIDVSRDMWIKERLTLSPAELAGIAVWLSLPWTVKMVFGELVDCVPIFGSQRKAYVLIGAASTASGMLTLAGAAGGWIAFARPDQPYILGAMLIVIGAVIQDVVADAMSTEVVSRRDSAGKPRPEEAVRAELGMVQVIGRLSLSFGILAVAGLSGWLAGMLARETVFLLGLFVPAVSVVGVLLIGLETSERRPLDWRILGGGIAFGAAILALALGSVPFGQELIFALSMAVICTMLVFVTKGLDSKTRRAILFHQHHHLRFPRNALGRRRLLLVDARPAPIRRGVLRHAAPDRGDHRHRGHVAVQQAVDRVFRGHDLVLARGGGRGAVAPQYRAVLRPPSLDGSDVRIRRPDHRRGRRRHRLPICTDQHGSAPDLDRLLRARRPPGDLVRSHGILDEHGAGRSPAADQVSQ